MGEPAGRSEQRSSRSPSRAARVLAARAPRFLRHAAERTRANSEKVVCVGLNKTGTTSLAGALATLGFKLGPQREAELLLDAATEGRGEEIVSFCSRADAFQDIPFNLPFVYRSLDDAFPNSRFILTVRDSPEQWFRSLVAFHSNLLGLEGGVPSELDLARAAYRDEGWMLKAMSALVGPWPDGNPYDQKHCQARYTAHNENVQRYFRGRPESLLVVNVGEPDALQRVADFLNVPPPEGAMPWLNKTPPVGLRGEKPLSSRLAALGARLRYFVEPSFIIVGAQKAGTSWLHQQLARHPDTSPPSRKELHFFDQDRAYSKGLAFYRSQFPPPHRARGRQTFESTPSYLHVPSVPSRIHHFRPDVRLIAVLRDPVDRAYSAWNMYRQMLTDEAEGLARKAARDYDSPFGQWIETTRSADGSFPSFNDLVEDELHGIQCGSNTSGPALVRRGLYAEQLERYLEFFERDQILVLEYTTMTANPGATLELVTGFLGMPSFAPGSIDATPINARRYDQQDVATTKDRLREFFQPHNARLNELLDTDLPWPN